MASNKTKQLDKWVPRQLVLPYNLLTAREYADLAGIQLSSAYRRAIRGQIECVMWNGRQLFVADMARDHTATVDVEQVVEYREVHGDPLVNEAEGIDPYEGEEELT